MRSSRLNVLISAHELNPYGGSECAEGWNIVTRLGQYHNITVLYASGSQFNLFSYEEAIKDYFTKNKNIDNIIFIPIQQTRITQILSSINKRFTKSKGGIGNPFLYYLGYYLWQRKAYVKAKELCKTTSFDIIHHLTSISFREPGLLWKLEIPFVWGPTGGLSKIPFSFYNYLGYKAYSKELIRTSVNSIQFSSNVRIKKALKRSSLIYTFSKEDELLFSKKSGKRTKILLDAATFSSKKKDIKITDNSFPINIIWCGEIIQRKALDILLYAINSEPKLKEKIKVKVLGGGPLEEYCKMLSKKLDIDNCIEWAGKISRETVFNLMGKADLLVHTSYREGTAHVITEALSFGLPVICHDINGMSIAINEDCGIKIPLISPEDSIAGFKEALLTLVNDPIKLKNLKVGALKRSMQLSWDNMAETIANDYVAILDNIAS